MWHLLLHVPFWISGKSDSTTRGTLICQITFAGITTSCPSIYEAVRSCTELLAEHIPFNTLFVPFISDDPVSTSGFGACGWTVPAITDPVGNIDIPIHCSQYRFLEFIRTTPEHPGESQAADRWKTQYQMTDFSSIMAYRFMTGVPNVRSNVDTTVILFWPLKEMNDGVTFCKYTFNAKNGQSESTCLAGRMNFAHMSCTGLPLPLEIPVYNSSSTLSDHWLYRANVKEINNKYFGVEKALVWSPFQMQDRVPAAGWSVALQSIQWMRKAAGPDQQIHHQINIG
ncbi:MAG: hypothetical protein K9I85_05395 [Saprospiraceae bacterium]|nr:hypothetical protein [Saprospiraceae bacterium]